MNREAEAAGDLGADEDIRELLLDRYLQAVQYERDHCPQGDTIVTVSIT